MVPVQSLVKAKAHRPPTVVKKAKGSRWPLGSRIQRLRWRWPFDSRV